MIGAPWNVSDHGGNVMPESGQPQTGDIVVKKTRMVCFIKRIHSGKLLDDIGNEKTPEHAVAKACKAACAGRVAVWLTDDDTELEAC
jgi:hypothetical protein